MRRLWLVIIAAVLVAAAGAWITTAWRGLWGRRPEVVLADGSVLRVEGLTWGTNQAFYLEPGSWTRLKRRLPTAWQSGIWEPKEPIESPGDPDVHLWVSRINPVTGAYLPALGPEFAHLDRAGTVFASSGGSSSGPTPGRADFALQFSALDWRADSLRFQVFQGGVTGSFTLPNPRRGERFPEWTPLPLPQTRQSGEFKVTMTGLRWLSPGWQPEFRVSAAGGEDATPWFDLQPMFVDPTGNRYWTQLPSGEPVWGVEVDAYPTARFPFPDAGVIPLGSASIPGAGQHQFFPMSAAGTNASLHSAWITGPGKFTFRDGQMVQASPVSLYSGGSWSGSIHPRPPWQVDWECNQPALWLVLKGPAAARGLLSVSTNRLARILPRLRRPDGSYVKADTGGTTTGSGADGINMILRFRIEGGVAGERIEAGIVLSEVIQARFTIAAPVAK
jgi:hypothetical protein